MNSHEDLSIPCNEISSLHTYVDIGDPDAWQPLFDKVPDYHRLDLCLNLCSSKSSYVLSSSLTGSAESKNLPFNLQGIVMFDIPNTLPEDDIPDKLMETVKFLLFKYANFSPDDQLFIKHSTCNLFIKLSDEYVAAMSVEPTFNNGCGTIVVTMHSYDDIMTLGAEDKNNDYINDTSKYEVFRKFTTIWAYAHDAITYEFSKNTSSSTRARFLTLAPPSPVIYMPLDELITNDRLKYKDIGGYDKLKEQLRDLALPFEKPELAENLGITGSHGILLHGPGGTGKTSILKALAGELDAELVELPVTQIIDKWVGSSGQSIDRFFEKLTKTKAKTVVLMDEFDAIGVSSDYASSGERTDVVNRLKEHIVNCAENHPHILMTGATNNLHRVDKNLLRPGRFLPVEMGLPNDQERRAILSVFLGKAAVLAVVRSSERPDMPTLDIAADINLSELAAASQGLVGAHFNEILNAIRRQRLRTYQTGTDMLPITHEELLYHIRQAVSQLE